MVENEKTAAQLRLELATLFVVSMSILGIEILLTRVFSVVLFASHSFMAISLALLGTGTGAIFAYLGRPLPHDARERRQMILLCAMSLAVVISLWGLLQIEFVPLEMRDPDTGAIQGNLSYNKRSTMIFERPDLFALWKLFAASPLAFLPFFIGGYLQAFIFRGAPKSFGMLYGVDLIGATVGSIFLPLLLYPFGLIGTIAAIAAITLVPAAYYVWTQARTWKWGVALATPMLVTLLILGSGSFRVKHAAGFAEDEVIREHWSPMARVTLTKYRPDRYKNREMYVVDNGSRTHYAPLNKENIRRYKRRLFTIPFEMKKGGDALVIASGGGQELSMGHYFGLKHIDAVEIARPIVTDILNEKADDPGNPYKLPGVRPLIADGRSVAMRADHQYDVVEMLEVNFHTLAGQISQAWSPFFVFTQEAYSEYLEHVKDDGYVCYTIFSRVDHPIAGEKGLRFRSMVAGMKLAGIDHPERNLVIMSRPHAYGYRTMYLAKKTPFTPRELRKIAKLTHEKKKRIEIHYPDLRNLPPNVLDKITFDKYFEQDTRYFGEIEQMIERTQPLRGVLAAAHTAYDYDVPVTDDRPYMFGSGLGPVINDPRERLIGDLYRNLLIVMSSIALAFIVVPFVIRRPAGGEKVHIDLRLGLILASTGLGFMFIEMAGIYKYQLYLHHPTIAMMVVLSSMILGAGLGSLHTGRIAPEKRRTRIAWYALGVVAYAAMLLIGVPVYLHRTMLLLPTPLYVACVFAAFVGMGFLLGHVVPLAIASFAEDQPNLLAWCWAITVTGSVFGTVISSILARDYGMSLVAMLGLAAYTLVAAIIGVGRLVERRQSA